ncbi:Alpha/Beta hydrolase protein [Exophiala viscosa]|uniref:Alpha/Beta hydrolase protein n=1 Tax=Exophiala viscosa TaxID=2486360 RepID=A0AAN6IDY8_9EURO|nr:Alpha/Beta hydrolase protein [Exophiala viscosa]KAI1619374.1 Alpha/Beta hydrolase protein [Exophiala viscosa]
MSFSKVFRITYWTLAAGGLAYALAVGALTYPTVQRNAVYAHKINPTLFQDLNNTEQFGFIRHQIQPFTLTTPDNVTLFAWHILPAHLYRQHEQSLKAQSDFGLKPWEEAVNSVGLQLLLNDPHAVAVVSFHGNAAHIASSYRPSAYQQIMSSSTSEKPVHVIAFDYRGFGLSTGSPTEDGVIQDSVTVVSALTGIDSDGNHAGAGVDPSRIILVGQSMGTFISAAFYHEWVLNLGRAPFRALVLIASFSSLTELLESYSIKGLTPPLLSPLVFYPRIQAWVRSTIVDKWDTSQKLVDLAQKPDVKLDLTMMHARDDLEIPWRQGRTSWDRVLDAATNGTIDFDRNLDDEEWKSPDGKKRLRWQRLRHGGHNKIPVSEHAKLVFLGLIEGDK